MIKIYFYNFSGVVVSVFNGFYFLKEYDNNVINVMIVCDLLILIYYFFKKYFDILNYIKYFEVKVMVGIFYEEIFIIYNYFIFGVKFGLEGVDGLKIGFSFSVVFNVLVIVKC